MNYDPILFLSRNWLWMLVSIIAAVALLWVNGYVIFREKSLFWVGLVQLAINLSVFVCFLIWLSYTAR